MLPDMDLGTQDGRACHHAESAAHTVPTEPTTPEAAAMTNRERDLSRRLWAHHRWQLLGIAPFEEPPSLADPSVQVALLRWLQEQSLHPQLSQLGTKLVCLAGESDETLVASDGFTPGEALAACVLRVWAQMDRQHARPGGRRG